MWNFFYNLLFISFNDIIYIEILFTNELFDKDNSTIIAEDFSKAPTSTLITDSNFILQKKKRFLQKKSYYSRSFNPKKTRTSAI